MWLVLLLESLGDECWWVIGLEGRKLPASARNRTWSSRIFRRVVFFRELVWEAAGLCSGDWLRGLSAADLRAVGVPVFPLPQDSSSSPCDAGEWLKKLNSATANPGLVGADPPLPTDQVCGGKRIHHRLVAAPRAQPGAPAATANVRPPLWHVCVSDIGV